MLDLFAKKEAPIQGMMGMGGGVPSRLLTLASGKITYVDDVFSTYVYTGTGSDRTITNGIDLAGEGGFVWTKCRNDTPNNQIEFIEGTTRYDMYSDLTNSATITDLTDTSAYSGGIDQYNSDGYRIKNGGANTNSTYNSRTYVSWTFRKCPGFVDIVTWTGNGVAGRQIAHSLGSTPGMIMVKCTSHSENWAVWHRSINNTQMLQLHSNDDVYNQSEGPINIWNSTTPTSTSFTVGNWAGVNANNYTYVAYIFAHNDGSFGEDSDEAVIKCGSWTASGGAATINLGFEPQFVITKCASGSGAWFIFDSMRGMFVDGNDAYLRPDSSNAESAGSSFIEPTSTGFNIENLGSSQDFIYIAIRRPHKPPEAGTEVFAAQATRGATNGTPSQLLFTAGFPVDLMMQLSIGGASSHAITVDRMRGEQFSRTSDNTTEISNDGYLLAGSMEGVYAASSQSATSDFSAIMFKRAPGFFDIVTYDGSNSAQNITHNLGVKPALIICKRRNSTGNWQVYADVPAGGATKYMMLDDSGIFNANSNRWNNTEPTATQFTVGTYSDLNTSGGTYVAYLFGNLDGICKIGQYTGTGNDITIDCGFNPRFIMIKVCTNSGDGWYIFDSARGINAGNDPWIRFNQSGQQITNTDIVDPTSGGFIVQAGAGARANDADGRKYLYWAIA